MFDEISFLVQETLKDAQRKQDQGGFFNQFYTREEELTPEEVPGFFYHLQKKASTFVIRIYPSDNLKQEYKSILKHPDLYPALRLAEDDGSIIEKLKFFECDRLEIAQSIKQNLGNKRFPLFEEHVFNISDPGDSWWLKMDEQEIKILFKLSYTDDISQLVKLGPLGDPEYAQDILKQLYGYFKLLFPISNYSSGHSKWCVSTTESASQNFNYLKDLFVSGEPHYDFWDYLWRLESGAQSPQIRESIQKANYFMMEIAATRLFWKVVQEEI